MNKGHDTDKALAVELPFSNDSETVIQLCGEPRHCRSLRRSLTEKLGRDHDIRENATDLLKFYTNQLFENFKHAFDPDQLICERGGQCLADVVKFLIDSGADVNVAAADEKTPLMLASARGYIAIVQLLIEKGASLERIDKDEETALAKAASNGHDDVAHLLLHFSADASAMVPQKERTGGATALHVAAGRGLARCVDHLLRNHVDRNSSCDHCNLQPLKAVTGEKQDDVVFTSSTARLDVNYKDHIGNTPLHWTCRKRGDGVPVEIIRALVERGAVVNERNYYERTPLHFAVINNNEPLVLLLIKTYGADVSAKDICGNTSLHLRLAANLSFTSRTSDSLIEVLLDCGAELNATNDEGMTPLHVACNRKYRTRSAIDLLIGCGASINEADMRGMTPLHYMFVADPREVVPHPSVVEEVFRKVTDGHGADTTSRTRYSQRTPLHLAVNENLAVEQEDPSRFPQLRKSVFIVDALHNTPCHYDVRKFLDLLCHDGDCDPSKHAKNKYGRSPYLNDVINIRYNFPSCIAGDEDSMGRNILHIYCSLFRHNMSSPFDWNETNRFLLRCRKLGLFKKTDQKGRSGLHHLCIAGIFAFFNDPPETEFFKPFSECLNDRDCLGRTALFYAAFYQEERFTLRLLDAGADPGIPDDEEIFPENIAAARGMVGLAVGIAAARKNRGSSRCESIYSRQGNHSMNSELVLSVSEEKEGASLSKNSLMEFDDFVRFVNHDFDEVLTESLQEHVTTFVMNVMTKVKQLDSRFSSVIYLVGSSHSRTRIKYPGDFDFSVVLTSFEKQATAQQNVDYPHCVTFRRNTITQTPGNTSEFEMFFMPDGTLDTQHIKHQLYLLIIEATSHPDIWLDNVFEYLNLAVRSEATSPAIKLTLTPNRMWINRTGKNGNEEKKLYLRSLSVDIVPCLRTGQPLMADSPLGLYAADYATDLKECIAIFKQPKFAFGPQMNGLCPASFVRVEAEVIRRSPAAVRAAYMWLKIQEKLHGVHSYMLQMCVLHCIVSKKFDQISFSEKVCERSLKECLGVITTELLDVIKQDEIRSVGDEQQRLPVWKFEPFAKFSVVYLDRLMGSPYPVSKLEFEGTSHPNFDLRPTDMLDQGQRESIQLESDTASEIQRCFKDAAKLCRQFVSAEGDSSVTHNDACSDQRVIRRIALYDECQKKFGSFMRNSRELDRIDPVFHACLGLIGSYNSLSARLFQQNFRLFQW